MCEYLWLSEENRRIAHLLNGGKEGGKVLIGQDRFIRFPELEKIHQIIDLLLWGQRI